MIYLLNSEFSEFWKKKPKNQKSVFFLLTLVREGNNTSGIVIILPYWLLKKSNAPHEILVSLQTVEKIMVSLKWWFQPHRDLLASVLFPTPLHSPTPPQLYSFLLFSCLQSFSFRILKFFLLFEICRFSLREKYCCFCMFDCLIETININYFNMISHYWLYSICK